MTQKKTSKTTATPTSSASIEAGNAKQQQAIDELMAMAKAQREEAEAAKQALHELSLKNEQLREENISIQQAATRSRQGKLPDDLRENQLNAFLSLDALKSADKGKNVYSSRGQSRRHIRIVMKHKDTIIDRVVPVNVTLSKTRGDSLILNAFCNFDDDPGTKTMVEVNATTSEADFVQSDDGTQQPMKTDMF